MDNVITAIFAVESEAYKAFVDLRNDPFGAGYVVAEAALVKRQNGGIAIVDSFDAAGVTSDDTATGMMVGSIVGILGGPLGVLLGASIGALTGSMIDTGDAVDSVSILEATAVKLYDGDCAIIAMVREEEPAFDAALEGYDATIIRHFAVDVFDEVDRARELEAQLVKEAKQQLRADRKAERKEKREQRKMAVTARLDAAKDKRAEKKAERKAKKEELGEAVDTANAQFTSTTNEMLGKE